MHLNGIFFFENFIFVKLLRIKSLFSLDMLNQMRKMANEKMAIDKFQRSRLTFNFSAKVAHIGVPSTHQNIVSSETTRPFELKFHMKTPMIG